MQSLNFHSRIPALLFAAVFGVGTTIGMTACQDAPTAARPVQNGQDGPTMLPINLEVSSMTAAAGQHIAVAVDLPSTPGVVGGIQGSLAFDPMRLRYIGQTVDSSSITLVNPKQAANGKLRFTSFKPEGVSGKVAHFIFEVKGIGYADSLVYVSEHAASAGANLHPLQAMVSRAVTLNASLAVPANARNLSVADWRAMINPAAKSVAIAARPGEYRTNLKYGDVDYDGTVGLFDYLGVANAAVGNDAIITGTDGPSRDVDLVVAGNVYPNTGGTSCGLETDNSRVLDLFDYLAIANEAVGINEQCVGDLIPGRGPKPTTVQSITASSTPALVINNAQTVTLTNDRVWQLEGTLSVKSGGKLIIEPGTVVQGNTAAAATQAIFVERGGQIFAQGTYERPITFTCSAVPKFKGCWGGIFIAGRDSVNLGDATLGLTPDGCNQRPGEGNAPAYGGCNKNDNSGIIQYAIIEYGGKVVGADNELNNLTLAGVGSGTTIDHIQVHGGTDDGVEFFGGSVNVKYVVLTGNDDDQFDISFGYRGNAQFVVTQADAGANPPDSKAIEADNNEPAPGTNAQPRTSPRLFNFTIIGNLATTQPAAIHLRRGTGPSINNFIVAGYPIGLDIDDPLTCDNFAGTPISIKSTTFIDVPNLGNDDSGDPLPAGGVCPGSSATEGEEAFINAESSNRVRTGIANVLFDAYNTDLPDWRMKLVSGQPAEGGVVTPPSNGFFTAVNYRGAVAPAGTAGDIPWYAGWTRGFQSPTAP